MATSTITPNAVMGKDGDWYYLRCGGYCILTLTYQITGANINTSTNGQYQSDTIDTQLNVPSFVKSLLTVSGACGNGSQGGGIRLHRIVLNGVSGASNTLRFILSANQSINSASMPVTVIVFGTC